MDTNFALVPGQQVYIKIIDLTSWATSVPSAVGCRCIDRHLDDTAARVSPFNGASLPSSPPRVDYWSSQTVDKS